MNGTTTFGTNKGIWLRSVKPDFVVDFPQKIYGLNSDIWYLWSAYVPVRRQLFGVNAVDEDVHRALTYRVFCRKDGFLTESRIVQSWKNNTSITGIDFRLAPQ